MATAFATQLGQRILDGQAPVVVGLDPRIEALPHDLLANLSAPQRIAAFYQEVLPQLAPHVPVVKPNIAFFERYGSEGYAAYEQTCRRAQDLGILVIGDIKRGDIGSTAEAYAEGHFQHTDAVTLHPYLGSDSIEPFLKCCRRDGKGVFILVRTSNPSATELQALETPQGSLSEAVAGAVHRWGQGVADESGYSAVGAVVGATYSDELATLRGLMPQAWLLLPGVGAQGAKVESLRAAFDAQGLGALISQSRGVMHCFAATDSDWREQCGQAAEAFAHQVKTMLGMAGSKGQP